jgi:dihydrofolate reductase
VTIRLSIIAAVAENGVIGAGNAMPWKLSSDLRRFKTLTMGKPVIMGRKTFSSIGKPLPGRPNIVVTRQADFVPGGVTVAASVDAALAAAEAAAGGDEIMVIGGGEVYRAAIDRADRLYITHVEAVPDGDTHFPPIDPAIWRATTAERLPSGPKDSEASTFVIYERIVPIAAD